MNKKSKEKGSLGFRAVILAAGKGTRMRSTLPKVLHKVCGRSLLAHVMVACEKAGAKKIIPILGHGKEQVELDIASYQKMSVSSVESVEQKRLLGTGDAMAAAMPALKGDSSLVLIVNGDGPLVTEKSILALLEAHRREKADLTLGVMKLSDPFGYGRIISAGAKIKKIREEKEATEKEKKISLVNGGIYIANYEFLVEFLPKIKPSAKTGEYYLTDLVALGAAKKKKISSALVNAEELQGVNDQEQLASVGAVLRKRILKQWMEQGVSVLDPSNTYVDADVRLAEGVILEPNVHLYGASSVGKGTKIEAGSYIRNSQLGENVVIKAYSHLEECSVGAEATVGPFARLRPGTEIGVEAKIGNFVEIKKSKIGKDSKVSHLSYIGDAIVGDDVNIGCGFITCNYDGFSKHITEIGSHAFIGSDVQAVAPVVIGAESFVASGTTVTKNVPKGALAIARQKQENKEGYAERLRARMKAIANSKKKEG